MYEAYLVFVVHSLRRVKNLKVGVMFEVLLVENAIST